MKKQDLVKVIREIIRQELKKELPSALAQVFQNLMAPNQPKELHSINVSRKYQPTPAPFSQPEKPKNELDEWKIQLKSMLEGGVDIPSPIQLNEQANSKPQPQPKQFTKNPVFNSILNQTRPFSSQERGQPSWASANGVGGMPPAVAMAGAQFSRSTSIMPETGVGQMMDDNELSFMKNVPGMPGSNVSVLTELPLGGAATHLSEGQEGGAAPMESLGEVSALDVKNHPALPDSIKGILNRDYRSLVKAMDKKK